MSCFRSFGNLFTVLCIALLVVATAKADYFTTATDGSQGYIMQTTAGGATSVFSDDLEDPQGIVISSTGTIFVVDNLLGGIYSVNASGTSTLFKTINTVYESGLAIDGSNTIYAMDFDSGVSTIRRFESNGNELTPWTAAYITTAMFYDVTSSRLYVTSSETNEVGYYNLAGQYNTYATFETAWYATGLTMDGDGNIYVSADDDLILKIATDLEVTNYVDQDLSGAMGLAWNGTQLVIANQACGCGQTNSLMVSDGIGGATELHDFGGTLTPSFVAIGTIPEPSTVMLLVCGAIAGIFVYRRRISAR